MSLDNVLPMSLERLVTYVPQRFIQAEAASRTEDAWTLGWPGPILNPRAHAVEPLEVPNERRQHQ
jgi:hypothetical protein